MRTLATVIIIFIAHFSLAQEMHIVRIQNLRDKPIVELNLNGKKTYFIIDTGSTISVLNSKSAGRFSFELIEDYSDNRARGLTTEIMRMKKVKKAKLHMDEVPLRVDLYAFDISHLTRSIREKTDIKITGILGADILHKYNFVIDYRTSYLTFSR